MEKCAGYSWLTKCHHVEATLNFFVYTVASDALYSLFLIGWNFPQKESIYCAGLTDEKSRILCQVGNKRKIAVLFNNVVARVKWRLCFSLLTSPQCFPDFNYVLRVPEPWHCCCKTECCTARSHIKAENKTLCWEYRIFFAVEINVWLNFIDLFFISVLTVCCLCHNHYFNYVAHKNYLCSQFS